MTLLPTRLPDAIVQMADHFPNMLLQYTLYQVRMMDNATHLMA